MIIEQVTLRGFQSFREETTIQIGGMSFAVITGPNGSGKSSIFDGISWTLFGKTRMSRDKDSIINDEEESAECSVDIRLIDGTLMRVIRERKWNSKTNLSIHDYDPRDGQWYRHTDHRIADAQDRIYRRLMMDEDSFFSMCSIEQGSIITGTRFTAASSNQRRAILMNLLPELNEWPGIEEIVAEESRKMNRKVEQWERDIESNESRLTSLDSELIENQSTLDGMKSRDEIHSEIDTLTEQIERIRKVIDADSEGKEDLKSQMDALAAQRRAKNAEIKSERTEISSKIKEIDSALRRIEDTEDDLDTVSKGLAGIEDNLEEAKSEKESIRERLEGIDDKIDAKESAVESAREELVNLRSRRKDASSRLEAMEIQGKSGGDSSCIVCESPLSEDKFGSLMDHVHEDMASLDDKIAEADSEVESAQSGLRRVKTRKQKLESNLADINSEIAREETRLKNSKERISSLEETLDELKSNYRSMPDRSRLEDRLEDLVIEKETEQEVSLRDQIDEIEREHPLSKELRSHESDLKRLRGSLSTIDRIEGRIEVQKEDVKKVKVEIRNTRDELEDSRDQRRYLDAARKACGQKGVPSMLLGEILSQLEEEQNRILKDMLGDDAFQVEFRQERELKTSDAVRSELDIIVHTPNGLSRQIETFSGGERVRLTLSNLFAMVKVFNDRHHGIVKTLLLDEPLGQLDNDALPIVTSIFRDMINAGVVNSILLMSHQEKIIDEAPQKIIVSRSRTTDNTTRIEIA